MEKQSKEYEKINYLDCFEWRWLTDDPPNWHTSFVIDFIARDGNRYVLICVSPFMVHGVTGKDCDGALKKFKDMLQESYDKQEKNKEKRCEGKSTYEIEVPNLLRYPIDKSKDGWLNQLWDEARSGPCSDSPSYKIGFKLGAELRTENEIMRDQWDDWLKKDTEFTKDRFFNEVKRIFEPYNVKMAEKGDELIFEGQTTLYKTTHYSEDERNLVEKMVHLNYHAKAHYDAHCCGTEVQCDGHGENFGQSAPCKTVEDLRRLDGRSFRTDILERKIWQKDRYEQMTIFEFLEGAT